VPPNVACGMRSVNFYVARKQSPAPTISANVRQT
jgi:hypothetical protein